MMSPWLFNIYMVEELREARTRCGRRALEVYNNAEEVNLFRLVNLVLQAENESDLRIMVECFD